MRIMLRVLEHDDHGDVLATSSRSQDLELTLALLRLDVLDCNRIGWDSLEAAILGIGQITKNLLPQAGDRSHRR